MSTGLSMFLVPPATNIASLFTVRPCPATDISCTRMHAVALQVMGRPAGCCVCINGVKAGGSAPDRTQITTAVVVVGTWSVAVDRLTVSPLLALTTAFMPATTTPF